MGEVEVGKSMYACRHIFVYVYVMFGDQRSMLPSFTELGTQPFSEGSWPVTPGIPPVSTCQELGLHTCAVLFCTQV